jgi:hypothetical protein
MTDAENSQDGPPKGKAKRSLKNYLLQPLLQVKLGLYCITLSVVFSAALGVILYSNFADLIDSVVMMTDLEDDVRDLFISYWKSTQIWIYLVFIVYLVSTISVSVLYTHRLVGPTIAFKRHVSSLIAGRYNARTYLRKGDAFIELGDELNNLSELMEKSGGLKDGK